MHGKFGGWFISHPVLSICCRDSRHNILESELDIYRRAAWRLGRIWKQIKIYKTDTRFSPSHNQAPDQSFHYNKQLIIHYTILFL